ncbi:unnamed protein product, partial [Ectocarpus sp. 12 AP-2014]
MARIGTMYSFAHGHLLVDLFRGRRSNRMIVLTRTQLVVMSRQRDQRRLQLAATYRARLDHVLFRGGILYLRSCRRHVAKLTVVCLRVFFCSFWLHGKGWHAGSPTLSTVFPN